MRIDFHAMLVSVGAIALAGCGAIHSDPVRELIDLQAGKIAQANAEMAGENGFVNQTNRAIAELRKSVAMLDQMYVEDQRQVLVRALEMSAESGTDDAWSDAAMFRVAHRSLEEGAGLDERILKQYEQDFAALQETAEKLQESWQQIATLHEKLSDYSDQSLFASIDRDFVNAVAQEIPGASESLEKAVKAAEKLNDGLEKLEDKEFFQSPGTRQVLDDLVDLLKGVAPAPADSGATAPADSDS